MRALLVKGAMKVAHAPAKVFGSTKVPARKELVMKSLHGSLATFSSPPPHAIADVGQKTRSLVWALSLKSDSV